MNLLKLGGLAVFFILIAGVGFYLTATRVPVENIDVSQLQAQLPALPNQVTELPAQLPELPEIPESASSQLSTLAQRSKEVGGHVQQVLGVSEDGSQSGVVTAGNQKPLHERALDHSLYLYCKGIVAEYEAE